MPVQLPHNFPPYDTSLSLFQKRKIWDSFLDLQPYIEDYYIVHTQCLATNGECADALVYLFFKDCSSLSNLSENCRKDWNLEASYLRSNQVPLVIRGLPSRLIKEIYPKDHKIHYGGTLKCFYNSL